MLTFLVFLGILGLGYLLLKANSLWIYRFFDRALRHDTKTLPKSYEVPRYYAATPSGEVDSSKPWPGWDGWYFFIFPDDEQIPVKMVRASLMSGLYGLQGIDSYEKLPRGASAFDAAEYLILVPTEEMSVGGKGKKNRFAQYYLPKSTLTMQPHKLEVAVTGKTATGADPGLYGQIQGAWSDYHFHFIDPEIGISLDCNYHGENLIWWADLPFFTYFAALGRFTGNLTFTGGQGAEEVFFLEGRGGFEHGFARKPWNFDAFWIPIRWVQKIIPSLRPVRYHYELFLGEGAHQGGFMKVRAFGIDWRNRGGLFMDGSYREISNIEVEYLSDPEPDLMPMGPRIPPVKFYRSWKIRAETGAGRLEYTAVREWPPARIASNMMYYNFSYEGTYRGARIRGSGYGEYVHI